MKPAHLAYLNALNDEEHLAYLNALNDEEQFPAAQCHMAHDSLPDICMYGKTASSGVESMNQANNDVRR